MPGKIKPAILRALAFLFSERLARLISRYLSRRAVRQIRGKATDKFPVLLLKAMEAAFYLIKTFRRNIEGFSGRYVFRTEDDRIGATLDFQQGKVKIYHKQQEDWNARLTFKNGQALRNFLFSEDQDILDFRLASDVEVDGNINYIYKFGFLARDLEKQLGVL